MNVSVTARSPIVLFHLSRRKEEFPGGVPDVKRWLRDKRGQRWPTYSFRLRKPSRLPKDSKIVFSIENRAVGEARTAGEVKQTNDKTYTKRVRLDPKSIWMYPLNPRIPKEIAGRLFKEWRERDYALIQSQSEIRQSPRQERAAAREKRKHRGGEKSREHKLLEESLERQPEKIEAGLRFAQSEYRFSTGDEIDILLTDQDGKHVTVEIEPAVGAGNRVGFLQALKYRYLFAAHNDLDVSEVRTMLVATRIHKSIKQLCRKYEVSPKELKTGL